MAGTAHRIGQQTLDIEIDSETAALTLQPRLGDINRRHFLPVIERVLDEFAVPGLSIKLDKIDIDLGTLPFEGFEGAAEARLAAALREAIERAVRDLGDGTEDAARPPQMAELEMLEFFLLHGTLPFGAPAQGFSAEAAILALCESDPAALAAMLRRHGRQRHVLERLVLQLSDAALGRLLAMLEPEHAAMILGYMIDLKSSYRVDPPLALSEPAFSQLLWVLALDYVLNDPGTQFNRKAFVRGLLEGISESERIAYGELIAALGQSLRITALRRPLGSSLPAIVGELLDAYTAEEAQDTAVPQDLDDGGATHSDIANHLAAFERWLSGQRATAGDGFARSIATLARTDPAAFERWLSRQRTMTGADDGATNDFAPSIAALARTDPAAFERWLSQQRTTRDADGAASGETALSTTTAPAADPGAIAQWLPGQGVAAAAAGADGDIARSILLLARENPAALNTALRGHGEQRDVFARLAGALDDAEREQLLFAVGPGRAPPILAMLVALQRWHRLPSLRGLDEDAFARLLWTAALEHALRPGAFERKALLRALVANMAQAASLTPQALLHALRAGETVQPPALLDLASELFGVALDDPPLSAAPAKDARDWLMQYLRGGKIAVPWPQAGVPAGDAAALLRRALEDDAQAAATVLRTLAASGGAAVLAQRLLEAMAPEELVRLLAGGQAGAVLATMRRLLEPGGSAGSDTERARTWAAAITYLLETPQSRVAADAIGQRAASAAGRGTAQEPASPGVASATEFPHADFRSYDLVEAARYVLRFGVLPWSTLLRDPAARAEDLLAGLAALPAAQLRTLFADANRETQQHLLARAASVLNEEALLAIVLRLLAQTPQGAAPFRASLLRSLGGTGNRRSLYARALREIFDGSGASPDEYAAGAAADGEVQALTSQLLALLRSPDARRLADGRAAALLERLIGASLSDAADVLRRIAADSELRDALQHAIPATDLRRLLAPLPDAEISALSAFEPGTDDILAEPTIPAASAPGASSAEALARSEAHALKSELMALLRSPDTTAIADARAHALLQALIAAHPLDAAEFLHAMAAQSALRDALQRRIGVVELRDVLAPLPRAQFPTLPAAGPARSEASSEPDGGANAMPPVLRDAILAFLRGDGHDDGASKSARLTPDGLVHGLLALVATAPDDVAQALRSAEPERRARMVHELPDAALVRLSHLLEPARHRALLGAAQTLAAAWRAVNPGQAPNAERDLMWSVLLDFLTATPGGERSVERLTAAFLKREAGADGQPEPSFLETASRLARASAQTALATALMPGAQEAAGRAPRIPRPPVRGKTAFGTGDDNDTGAKGTPIYIPNAGLILTAPFLPHLFSSLKLTAKDDKGRTRLRDRAAISRAVHLLQYLVDGRTDAPEPLLVLNKILSGQQPQIPVAPAIELSDEERALCDSLLKAMIQNWTAIANTSVAGLRETFLRREGKLERGLEGWKLTVQRKTLDVLVDQVPWTVSMVYLDWMTESVNTTW